MTQPASSIPHRPVLIVGSGPAGMTAAALLHRQGVPSFLIERHAQRLTLPKAHVINPVTLDACATAGFDVDAMIANATPLGRDRYARFRDRLLGRELGALPFERQLPQWVARRRINLPQPKFEQIAADYISTLADVHRVVGRWVSSRQDGDLVVSTVLVDGVETEFASNFLIGADGASSAVRTAAGIAMLGTVSSQDVVSVHFRADLSEQLRDAPAAMYWILDPKVTGGFIAHDIAGSWVYTYYPENGIVPDLERARARVIAAIGPDADGNPADVDVIAVSPWTRGSQVAERFATGTTFLMGDAAHRLPPTGGLGLNTGVQDAVNLTWKLGAYAAGWAPIEILSTYDAERRPVAITNTEQSTLNSATIRALYETAGTAIATGMLDTFTDEELAHLINAQWDGHNSPALQLGQRYGVPWPAGRPVGRYEPDALVGGRLPHGRLLVDGSPRAVHDLIAPTEFTLFTDRPASEWSSLSAQAPFPLRVLSLIDCPALDAHWLELMDFDAYPGVLVRPDGHLAVQLTGSNDRDVEAALTAVANYVARGDLFMPSEFMTSEPALLETK